MVKNIHLAILDADIPARALYELRGLYSAQFRDILQTAVLRLNSSESIKNGPVRLKVSAYDIHGGNYPPYNLLRQQSGEQTTTSVPEYEKGGTALGYYDYIDAILITGSAPAVYQAEHYPWMLELEHYIQTVYQDYPRVKLLGSCFGHQLIAKALLSRSKLKREEFVYVEKCPFGREIGLFPVKINPDFALAFPILSTLPKRELRIQMMHGDWVVSAATGLPASLLDGVWNVSLPKPWVNMGSTAICPIQGLFYPKRVLTIQGHFELDAFAMQKTCIEFGPLLGWSPAQLTAFLEQIGQDTFGEQDDYVKLAEVVVLFLCEADSRPYRTFASC